jgi:hypothetical protein
LTATPRSPLTPKSLKAIRQSLRPTRFDFYGDEPSVLRDA